MILTTRKNSGSIFRRLFLPKMEEGIFLIRRKGCSLGQKLLKFADELSLILDAHHKKCQIDLAL